MKIIALLSKPSGWNQCVSPFFSLPDSAIVKNGNPVYLPDFDTSFSGHIFWAVKITRLGKNIATRFAKRYYSQIAPVILIAADNLLKRLKEHRLAWSAAVGFDKSVVLGEFIDYNDQETSMPLSGSHILLSDSDSLLLEIEVPQRETIDMAVTEVARYNSLKMGDLILIPAIAPESILLPLKIDTLLTIRYHEDLILKLPLK